MGTLRIPMVGCAVRMRSTSIGGRDGTTHTARTTGYTCHVDGQEIWANSVSGAGPTSLATPAVRRSAVALSPALLVTSISTAHATPTHYALFVSPPRRRCWCWC